VGAFTAAINAALFGSAKETVPTSSYFGCLTAHGRIIFQFV
jgi:hypothetical protein